MTTTRSMSLSVAVPLLLLLLFLHSTAPAPAAAMASNVTFDHRSLIIDGRRKLLISTSIHYPRSVPAMWPGLVQLAKEGGADVIESYVFWNGHELSPDNYYFEDRFDLVNFVKIVQQAGMYMMLRIGPFVAAEWNYGGIPVWLHYVPGTVFRTDNKPFKYYMQKFTTNIVNKMKQEKLFASQGGPIILAQIENEYAWYEQFYEGGKAYAMWAAQMALSQNIGVPWIMCQENDAPYPVIDTCNSFYCDSFIPNSPKKPKIWTENWPGWFKLWGSRDPHRPAEDVAFSVARFFQKGGSVHNYYMYHGGTNFGRTAGRFITTSYDYDAPIDEYGLARFPKWGHLKELHAAIKLCEQALLNNKPTHVSLGPLQEADVYVDSSGACAAFLANMDDKNDTVVDFRNKSYNLPAWSVSILPDCKNVVFNTAKVGVHTSIVQMVPENLEPSVAYPKKDFKVLQWEVFEEKAGLWTNPDFSRIGFIDHINTTKDKTDYLWLATSFYVDEKEVSIKKGVQPVLSIESLGHALHAFLNGEFQGSGHGLNFTLEVPISPKVGVNEIALLSMAVGLQSAGTFFEWAGAGVTSVKILGLSSSTVDLSRSKWNYKIGLEGEHLLLSTADGFNSMKWLPVERPLRKQALTWYKAVVDPPSGNDPVGLDMIHMGKGLAWLNGKEIGRYWTLRSYIHDQCVEKCDYRGTFFQEKCVTGCGEPTQRWYHVPRSWFNPMGNVLVIFEEMGGDPTKISFSKRKTSGACTLLSEDHPSSVESWSPATNESNNVKAAARLSCPGNAHFSAVKFASFGNPVGSCGFYSIGDCHDPNSASVVEKLCLNKSTCTIELSHKNFDEGLCPDMIRRLAVEAVCS